jgi:valyl-tRNA synthetase
MPFITEELWGMLRQRVGASAWPDSIMEGRYPAVGPVDEAAEKAFAPVLGIIDAIRNIRGEMNIAFKVALGQETPVHVAVSDAATLALLQQGEARRVARLTHVEKIELHLSAATPRVAQSTVGVGAGFEVRVPLAGVIDVGAETARIDKELGKVDADLRLIEGKLSNPNFVARAPAEVVEKDRARAEELRTTRQKLINHRAVVSGADQPKEEKAMETNNPNPSATPAPAAPAQPVGERVEQAINAGVEAVKAEAVKFEQQIEKKAAPTIKRARKAVADARKGVAGARKAVKKGVADARKAVKKGVADARKAVKRGVAGARKAVKSTSKRLSKKAPVKAMKKVARKPAKPVAKKKAAKKAKKK